MLSEELIVIKTLLINRPSITRVCSLYINMTLLVVLIEFRVKHCIEKIYAIYFKYLISDIIHIVCYSTQLYNHNNIHTYSVCIKSTI